jgi:hypothetical protein
MVVLEPTLILTRALLGRLRCNAGGFEWTARRLATPWTVRVVVGEKGFQGVAVAVVILAGQRLIVVINVSVNRAVNIDDFGRI